MKKGIILLAFLFMVVIIFIPDSEAALGTGKGIIDHPYVAATLIAQKPDPAEPGKIVELRWNVWNNGSGILKDVKFRIAVKWPFSFVSEENEVKNIGNLKASDRYNDVELNTSAILYYRLILDPKAPSGDYQIWLEYSSDKNEIFNEWQKLPVYIIRVKSSTTLLDIENFETIPERIKPGEEGKLLIKLTNKGGVDLKNIKVKLDLDDDGFSPVGSTNEKLINYLEKDFSAMIEYKLLASANAVAKEYKIPIAITYKDESNTEYTKNNTLTLLMDTTPDYFLALEDTEIYYKNSKGKIVLSLSNIGQTDLKYLTMELANTNDYEVLGKTSEYLGNLESDDYETADFQIYVKNIKKKNVPLNVKITYKDNYNKVYSEEKIVNMPLYTKSQAKEYGLVTKSSAGTTIIFVLIVILIIGYILYRKRKKNNNKS